MDAPANPARPLEGLRVIDLTRALAGPYATLLLAGLGAEVIKVEDPLVGDLSRANSPYVGPGGIVGERGSSADISVSFLTRSRGKRGISLNLKAPEAPGLFLGLVKQADIVMENFPSGTAARLGIGYEQSREANPRIIYCSLSGFGATASDGGKAMDIIIQALSGVMYTSGSPGDPPVRIGVPMADVLAPLYAVIGILAAVEQRHRTGVGQLVDISMLGVLTAFVAIENWAAMAAVGMEMRTGLTMPRLTPFGVFPCVDGHVAIVAMQENLSQALFRAMGRPELGSDPRFATRDARVTNTVQVEAAVAGWTRSLTVAEAVAALAAEGVPASPVRGPQEALADPRVLERGEVHTVRHPTASGEVSLPTTGVPIRFSGAGTGFDAVLPVAIGEHNAGVYGELLGCTAERLRELKARGVI